MRFVYQKNVKSEKEDLIDIEHQKLLPLKKFPALCEKEMAYL